MIVGNDRAAAIAELERRIAAATDWRLIEVMQHQLACLKRDAHLLRGAS